MFYFQVLRLKLTDDNIINIHVVYVLVQQIIRPKQIILLMDEKDFVLEISNSTKLRT